MIGCNLDQIWKSEAVFMKNNDLSFYLTHSSDTLSKLKG